MRFIDTHAHLYLDQFEDDIDEVMDHALGNGVDTILLPNIDRVSIDSLHRLVADFPEICKPMMGLHPCSVKADFQAELDHMRPLFEERDYVAVGEIGIDMHWDKSTLPLQLEAFRQQIGWAKELDLPIVIHARESFDEIFEVVDELNDADLRGVFHCFTGTPDQARHILDYGGFKMGIGGVLTYKNAGLKETLKDIPIEHIVLETDAPYLSPVPFRGKRNESSYVLQVAIEMSKVYDLPITQVAEQTTQNAIELFRLDG
ncbi:MAG: TatD family hydrolase [Flavobacteriales bacterium]|nr:TatD family hydrolase [Flavobacteriales bacterium]